eukprot:2033974-Heterocapsa_arctica.AAC.1
MLPERLRGTGRESPESCWLDQRRDRGSSDSTSAAVPPVARQHVEQGVVRLSPQTRRSQAQGLAAQLHVGTLADGARRVSCS